MLIGKRNHRSRSLCALIVFCAVSASPATATLIWVEGEKPIKSTMNRHPWWYDQVKKNLLSGDDLISNFHATKAGEAEYRFEAPTGRDFEFWVRANPLNAQLSYALNGAAWISIELAKNQQDVVNIAAKGEPDLRFLAWVKVGRVALKKGVNTVRFRMDGPNSNHGYLDCFVFTDQPFQPRGKLKPGQMAAAALRDAARDKNWFPFDPKPDPFSAANPIDLRRLNEKVAGERGFVHVKGSHFVLGDSDKPVRFWAVNGPSSKDREGLREEAKMLAKHGVNLVRIHHGYFDEKAEVKPAEIEHAHEVVEALKAEGIYSHFSIYFPLWLAPKAGDPTLAGYNGQHPFASLFFNKEFQKRYREWWKALLLTPSKTTGKPLIDEPAVASLEALNEDSYFFWTFNPKDIPDAQLRIVESQFADWLKERYGSLEKAAAAWNGATSPRDEPAQGRIGFRPLWNMANEKLQRDKDAARFLLESQRRFYQETVEFLRGLGFKGVVTASNWVTADPKVFGPLEKYSYTVADFIDRHGYFGCRCEGVDSGWAIKPTQTYSDRSALRFDAEEGGKKKAFVHPAMDPHYAGKPSMISETTWNRPNRFRSEAPLYYAVYGALQDSDAIVHFALDGARWSTKPGFFMQPWTLMTPAMMGQFPAAALIYRKGLISAGEVLLELNLKLADLYDLQGTPLPQDAAFDELRLRDVPKGTSFRPGNVVDPLIHYAGRVNVQFSETGAAPKLANLSSYIDHRNQRVKSTTGELELDFGKGVLTLNAPAVQGASGALAEAGTIKLADLTIDSELSLAHIVAVSLDDQPLARSRKILLQVMSEEKSSGFRTEKVAEGVKKIVDIGHDPWLVRKLEGTVRFTRQDASALKVSALDGNGEPMGEAGTAAEIKLRPDILYYLVENPGSK